MRLIDKLRPKRRSRPGRQRNDVKYIADPVPHPLRQFFVDREISSAALAGYLDVNPGLLSMYLNGLALMPLWVDEKLRRMADQIKAEEAS